MIRSLLLLALVASPTVAAAEIQRVDVRYSGGEYHVVIDAVLHAKAAAVFGILTDYARWHEINDLIKESEVEEVADASAQRVRTVSEGCVLAFCKRVEQVQWMRTAPGWQISAELLPERSDLKSGWARTVLVDNGDHTVFRYEMALVPDFWVPPIVGPYIVRRKLHRQAVDTAHAVEAAARNQ